MLYTILFSKKTQYTYHQRLELSDPGGGEALFGSVPQQPHELVGAHVAVKDALEDPFWGVSWEIRECN